ncbi:beta-ketoacyl-[acyl-carrier-protein] synthase family protein [Streptosporangium carneum]|uniref:3-oxoacyl-[acyl-carrier-protein] synthase 2 n=1 Tax=Streptosporangium carneum TaxID=47481 RepID=A0A9W6I877_9ACTN|nr:beta-ketoacyl-[acyl-carrier-protein] synthase family protein [Streptosporangium carneum]GLK13892.1 3-oxoacyl-[acyl-carrier-protein] synthase 2 [Streptosporangium carneum]
MNGRRRVAVTGLGVKSPAGNTVETLLERLREARSTAATVDELVKNEVPVTFACTVPEFDLDRYVALRQRRQMDRGTTLALAAAADAVDGARLGDLTPERVGIAVGTGVAGLGATEEVLRRCEHDPARMPAFTVPQIMANSAAARIGMRLGARGTALTYATACASGATAIGEATLKIRSGECDVMIAGGVDAPVTPMVMAAFARIGALSGRNDDPEAACRPFDADRDGFVMGEGAAFLVLEDWEHAERRGADVLGEVLGYGSNSDAHHIVAPREDGGVAAACMARAVQDAGLSFADIGHVNAHGTSTYLNDRAEARALASCFAGRCPPVTAPKGVVGHLIGAAGALEAVISLGVAAGGLVPPVANFGTSECADEIDLVTGAPRRIGSPVALSNSFAFGGHNVSLVLRAA